MNVVLKLFILFILTIKFVYATQEVLQFDFTTPSSKIYSKIKIIYHLRAKFETIGSKQLRYVNSDIHEIELSPGALSTQQVTFDINQNEKIINGYFDLVINKLVVTNKRKNREIFQRGHGNEVFEISSKESKDQIAIDIRTNEESLKLIALLKGWARSLGKVMPTDIAERIVTEFQALPLMDFMLDLNGRFVRGRKLSKVGS